MLVGKKVKDIESGYIFAPYLIASVDPIVIGYRTSKRKAKIAKIFTKNYVNYNPKNVLKSRYVTKMINSSFYGTFDISGPIGASGPSGHTGIPGPSGHPGNPGIPYNQWNRKKRIETIFNKKSS